MRAYDEYRLHIYDNGYDASDIDTVSVTSLLETLAPTAQVTQDTAQERLLVIGSMEDHATVDNVLQQASSGEGTGSMLLKSYPLSGKTDADTLTSLLSTITPNASVTSDATARRLLITGTEKDHERIAQTISQVAQDAGGEVPQLQFYPLKNAASDSALAILQAMLPAATISFEASANRLTVVATKADHDSVQATLTKLEATAPADEKRTLKNPNRTKKRRSWILSATLPKELSGGRFNPFPF